RRALRIGAREGRRQRFAGATRHWQHEGRASVIPSPPSEPPPVGVRFPEPRQGEDVVAVSRTLSPALVLEAYKAGIFPWPVRQGLVPWDSPHPRAIVPLQGLEPWPRTVRRALKAGFRVSFDVASADIMSDCGSRP